MIAFSFGYENIPVSCGVNADSSYGDGRTYGSDGGFKVGLVPKPSVAMFGTLTRILDQAEFVRMLPGMPFVYCYEFRRKDGKNVYAYWTADREVLCKFTLDGNKEVITEDLYGRRENVSLNGDSFTSAGNNVPKYFVTEGKIRSAKVLSTTFDLPAVPEKTLCAISLKAENLLVTNEEDFYLSKQKEEERHPFKIKNRIPAEVTKYIDKTKGAVTKISFDISSLPVNDRWNHGGYTVIRLKEPVSIPKGADYLGVGAIYPTTTKVKTVLTSVDTLKEIVKAVPVKVNAIGGLNRDNIHVLKDSGIDGICVVSAIMKSENPRTAAEELKTAFAEVVE